jgi:hypothetical protein
VGVGTVGVVLRGAVPDGYGYGSGYGRGYGSGYGDGYGDGYGYGSGHGDGHGYGHGYGHDYGSGRGAGYGHGDGYWTAVLSAYTRPDATIALWRSDRDGSPSNGGHSTVARVGLVEELPGPLRICSRGFHATVEPARWRGYRLWVVALYGEIQREDDKLCALKREFLAEIKWGGQ